MNLKDALSGADFVLSAYGTLPTYDPDKPPLSHPVPIDVRVLDTLTRAAREQYQRPASTARKPLTHVQLAVALTDSKAVSKIIFAMRDDTMIGPLRMGLVELARDIERAQGIV